MSLILCYLNKENLMMLGNQIKDLKVEVDGEEILKGLNLTVKEGEVVGLMGRNGSGKSTLAKVIFGHPDYEITKW